MILHATLIASYGSGRWSGVLIRGPSGAGKSTLALRCMAMGFALVADDRVVTWTSGDRLYGKAPVRLAGLIEVRGLGVIPSIRSLNLAPILLVADLVESPPSQASERMPEAATTHILGLSVPNLTLSSADAHAGLRLSAALAASQHGL